MNQLTFFAEEPHVSRSRSEGFVEDWLTPVEASCSHILPSLHGIAPVGSFGRMSLAFCPAKEEGILEPSSGGWGKSGMGSPIECWTLNTSASPSNARACSLWEILIGDAPQRFFLSQKALEGVLKRDLRRTCRFVSLDEGRVLSTTEKHTLLRVDEPGT